MSFGCVIFLVIITALLLHCHFLVCGGLEECGVMCTQHQINILDTTLFNTTAFRGKHWCNSICMLDKRKTFSSCAIKGSWLMRNVILLLNKSWIIMLTVSDFFRKYAHLLGGLHNYKIYNWKPWSNRNCKSPHSLISIKVLKLCS